MNCVALFDVFKDSGIGLAEKSLVETVAETLAGLSHFLFDFLVEFCKVVLNEHVGAIAFFRVAVVNQRVVESIDVA